MSHAFIVMNDAGVEQSAETIPGFEEVATSRRPEITNMGERGILGTGLKRAWRVAMFQSEIPLEQWADIFEGVLNIYQEAGATTFGSRVDHGVHLSAFNYLLRNEGSLPARYAFSYEVHRNEFMSAQAVEGLYSFIGSQWQKPENEWLWPHGLSSEGAWSSPGGAVISPDLEAQGIEVSEEAKAAEFNPPWPPSEQTVTPEVLGLQNGIQSGWRIAAVHGTGSHGVRLFLDFVENAVEETTAIDKEYVQDARFGLAHGTTLGKPSVVMDDLFERVKDWNVYLPINVGRALREEWDVLVERYGEDVARDFLAPVNTLIEEGVKVVGETENFTPEPGWYSEMVHAYVNRYTRQSRDDPESEDTETITPEEGVDRVQALKLLTSRSAEFLQAEEEVGSIETGKLADFVVMENDILEVPEDEIRDNKPIVVGLDGEIEHQADEAEDTVSVGTGREAFAQAVE